MKNIFIYTSAILVSFCAYAQTNLEKIQDAGTISIWNLVHESNNVGKVYTIKTGAQVDIKFYPKEIPDATMVLTGTYTAPSGKVAGHILGDNNEAGDMKDPFFMKSNGVLIVDQNSFRFAKKPEKKCFGVYQVLHNSEITQVVQYLTTTEHYFRFLVHKEWTKEFANGKVESGSDWMVIDLEKKMTITQAVNIVQGLKRNQSYIGFKLRTNISACLLDTGTYRPMVVNGQNVHGPMPVNQSNLIVIH